MQLPPRSEPFSQPSLPSLFLVSTLCSSSSSSSSTTFLPVEGAVEVGRRAEVRLISAGFRRRQRKGGGRRRKRSGGVVVVVVVSVVIVARYHAHCIEAGHQKGEEAKCVEAA